MIGNSRVAHFTALAGVLVTLGSCSAANTGKCTANARECVGDGIARVCPADGSGWLALRCGTGEVCDKGTCKSSGVSVCLAGKRECVDSKISRVCQADGLQWVPTACKSNETCDNGECKVGGQSGVCTANAKECVTASLARVCSPDGSGWYGTACRSGESCANGECRPSATSGCSSAQNACTNDTTAVRCNAQSGQLESISCPSGTTCHGAGTCAGICEVGSAFCSDVSSVSTCNDGKAFSTQVCPAGQACVQTFVGGQATAACKPAECYPRRDAPCGTRTCGNRAQPTADQTRYYSECVATGDGYRWVPIECAPATSCSATGGTCSVAGVTLEGCSAVCTPGESRCADGGRRQVCDASGRWGPPIVCSEGTGGAQLKACVAVEAGLAVCGDVICTNIRPSVCEGANVRRCGRDGRLEATAAPCASGKCVSGGGMVGGLQPGRCEQQCVAGEETCADSLNYQTCENGRWSVPKLCIPSGSTTALCRKIVTANGLSGKLCGGVCTPGDTRCNNSITNPSGGSPLSGVERCGADGTWGTAVVCALGTCSTNGTSNAGCRVACVPGSPWCIGDTTPIAGTTGYAAYGQCSSDAKIPDVGSSPTCASGTYCRKDFGGNVIVVGGSPCLECVGSGIPGGNGKGFVDGRCVQTTVAGIPRSGIEYCGSDNRWGSGTTTLCEVGYVCGASASGPPTCVAAPAL